jgi:hypothetical protein
VATVEYQDKGGGSLGKVELFKRASTALPTGAPPGAAAPRAEYFVRSERTRGLARVSVPAGERVDQDVAQIVP